MAAIGVAWGSGGQNTPQGCLAALPSPGERDEMNCCDSDCGPERCHSHTVPVLVVRDATVLLLLPLL